MKINPLNWFRKKTVIQYNWDDECGVQRSLIRGFNMTSRDYYIQKPPMFKLNLIRKEEQEQLDRLREIKNWRDNLCPHKERLRLINEINAKYGLLTKRLTKKLKGEPYNLCDTGFSFQPLN